MKGMSAGLGIPHDWGWEGGLEWVKMRESGKIFWLLLHLSEAHIGPINYIFAISVCEFWENARVKGLVCLGWKALILEVEVSFTL